MSGTGFQGGAAIPRRAWDCAFDDVPRGSASWVLLRSESSWENWDRCPAMTCWVEGTTPWRDIVPTFSAWRLHRPTQNGVHGGHGARDGEDEDKDPLGSTTRWELTSSKILWPFNRWDTDRYHIAFQTGPNWMTCQGKTPCYSAAIQLLFLQRCSASFYPVYPLAAGNTEHHLGECLDLGWSWMILVDWAKGGDGGDGGDL